MKHIRRFPVTLVICLVAAVPVAWGAGVTSDATIKASADPKQDLLVTVTLCHFQGGDFNSARTLRVPESSVEAHVAHGDYLRACFTCPLATAEPCFEGGMYDLSAAPLGSATKAAKATKATPSGP